MSPRSAGCRFTLGVAELLKSGDTVTASTTAPHRDEKQVTRVDQRRQVRGALAAGRLACGPRTPRGSGRGVCSAGATLPDLLATTDPSVRSPSPRRAATSKKRAPTYATRVRRWWPSTAQLEAAGISWERIHFVPNVTRQMRRRASVCSRSVGSGRGGPHTAGPYTAPSSPPAPPSGAPASR